jgi:predicted anti-sigma-YlaC factor YlaD
MNESCTAFQAQLPEAIGSGKSLATDTHLQRCPLCRALLIDLETIADAARKLFPIEEPSESLWRQIETAIEGDSSSLAAL